MLVYVGLKNRRIKWLSCKTSPHKGPVAFSSSLSRCPKFLFTTANIAPVHPNLNSRVRASFLAEQVFFILYWF
jgi:hypothetical protein